MAESEKKPEIEKPAAESGNDQDVNKVDLKQYGFDHFPDRRGKKKKTPFWRTALLGEGREEIDKIKCERRVFKILETSPMVKLMLSALRNSDCEVDYRRHISCEECDGVVSGGYDPIMNQVVICQNVCKNESVIHSVLTHEFIHMYDYCRAELDFKNLDHLACTEIRAANITHCSFMSAWMGGTASPFSIAKQHAECVKEKALNSMLAARDVTKDVAMESINRVFERCYNDLSPVGRRIRRNSLDMQRAYRDRYLYGLYD